MFAVFILNFDCPQKTTYKSCILFLTRHRSIKIKFQGFAKDRKELILQYLSGLASPSQARDQSIVTNFPAALDSRGQGRDPMFYLGIIQKMKGEWYNQEGEF